MVVVKRRLLGGGPDGLEAKFQVIFVVAIVHLCSTAVAMAADVCDFKHRGESLHGHGRAGEDGASAGDRAAARGRTRASAVPAWADGALEPRGGQAGDWPDKLALSGAVTQSSRSVCAACILTDGGSRAVHKIHSSSALVPTNISGLSRVPYRLCW